MTSDDVNFALRLLEGHFDRGRTARMISGVAITKTFRDSRGYVIRASAIRPLQLPLPLLLSHNPLQPVGLVRSLETRGEQLRFVAEVANSDRQYWVQQSWPRIAAGEWTRVSVHANGINPTLDKDYDSWALLELSIVGNPMDRHAGITRVWERAPVVYCDGRPSTKVHWSLS